MALFSSTFSNKFAQLFNDGWFKPPTAIERAKEERIIRQALEVPQGDDGSHVIDDSIYHSPTLAIESSMQASSALVNEYRAMGLDLDVDTAVDDIVNAIVTTDEDEQPVTLNLDAAETLSEAAKKVIQDEFKAILEMMEFNQTGYEKVRQWYIDGRQYWQMVIDDQKKADGIKKLILLDPRAMKKYKSVHREMGKDRIQRIADVENFYIYNTNWSVDTSFGNGATTSNSRRLTAQTLRIDADSIAYVHSGILSPDGNMVFSHLEKSRKPLNNLKMMRDAMVIYRITRAPERRVFYVDVGSLPTKTAESYVMTFMNRNKSKMSYDSVSGKVNGHAYQSTMLEDFWMPRREGGRGTEVTTLQGASNLSQIDDILYFQKLLFRSLNVPMGRLENDNSAAIFGSRGTEITRDEWKFAKFVNRLRRRYSMIFDTILKTQLMLKNIMTEDEWEEVKKSVRYQYASDSFVKQQQEDESLNARIAACSAAESVVDKYVSREWIKRNLLKMSDEDIAHEDEQMSEELAERKKDNPEGDEPTASPFG